MCCPDCTQTVYLPLTLLTRHYKDGKSSYKCKNYYGKKVWTANAADVEWVECERVNKTSFVTQLESQIKFLSGVRTLSGLYLVKPIDMDKSFQPSPQLASYMDKIRKFKNDMLEKRQQAISKTFSN